jgi:hypothetical protein
MTLDRDEAAATLSDIASVERRTRATVTYARSSTILIMWGVLCVIGYVFEYVQPRQARPGWIAVTVLGFAATFVLMRWRTRPERFAQTAQPLIYAQLALIGYGLILLLLLWPLDPRQICAFWPTLYMLGFVLAGLWLGRFFILCGLAVTALTVAGYFWSGDWFPLWMALVNGGGLLAGGLWLRRLR